ncbi:DUF1576 domain-containing protein [Petrocella sp. FN5]|uniref:DUF1576 domain-containing protein n=1 Tax=Petrocella sp. FN5 TaxID=3032002 RepID=UPI0023DA181B|nr:DUF1576 domain-containing protein [Petrocella sp. FN5]MDF1615884.1 DUF1576 domain-containing protein [Petrocella sp. FN5]
MIYSNSYEEKELQKEGKQLILSVFPLVFMVFGIIYGIATHENLLEGLMAILFSPTTLLTDFLKVGGVGATFVNAALVGIFNIYLLRRFEMRINGLLIAAIFTVIGFSFFGKNILNIMPIYLGGYLYARRQGIAMKNIILIIMFSTALAPIVSEITFGGYFDKGFNYFMGALIGTLIGFIIVPLSSHMLKFHDGYNLYNIGFTAGIVGTVFTSLLRNFKMHIAPVNILDTNQHMTIVIMLYLLFAYLVLMGYRVNNRGFEEYKNILKYRGRTITDFTELVGYGITFINMGLLGILSTTLVLLLGGIVNGPVIAGILTIVGFGAFGKHPKNCLPIVLGVLLGGFIFGYDFTSTGFIISILFSTTIAPIAGSFGPIIGIIAGILHLTLVTNVGVIHGGINLYNNGFAGGLVAGFLIPIIDAFKKGE